MIVNWNSETYLRAAVGQVRRCSPPGTVVRVVDNGSRDGSLAYLRACPDVETIRLPMNVGHELAMDIGFLTSRTTYVVALDVDAFPISSAWLDTLLGPLEHEAHVSGAHVVGGFVHPCCLAMRFDRFVDARHSFLARRSQALPASADDPEPRGWDTGWSISLREPLRNLIDVSEVRGPGQLGTVFGAVVYHNFYAKRLDQPKMPLTRSEVTAGVTRQEADAAWADALERYEISG